MTRKKLCLFRPFIQTTSWLYPIIEPVQRNHKCSQMLASHTFIRKSVKWTTKVAFHFIKEAISTLLFCFVLFRSHNKRSLFKTFKIDLCNSLITEVLPAPLSNHGYPRRLKQHFLIPTPPTEKKNYPTRKCVVCTKHKTRKECGDCHDKPDFSIHWCFKNYHMLDDYY